jgi:hypothetical protein
MEKTDERREGWKERRIEGWKEREMEGREVTEK